MPNPNNNSSWDIGSWETALNWRTVPNADSTGFHSTVTDTDGTSTAYNVEYTFAPDYWVIQKKSVVDRYKNKKVRECGLSLFLKRIDKNETK